MTKSTTLDDIAESISDLTTMVADEFMKFRQAMAAGDEALRQEIALVRGEMVAGDNTLRQEMQQGFAVVNQRISKLELEAFAMQVAEKTGIPFYSKSKRRS